MGSDELFPVRQGDRWGYRDAGGRMVIVAQFDSAGGFSEGLARVKVDGKWGYIDTRGKIVIAPQFDQARLFSSGIAKVKQGNIWGYIERSGLFVEQLEANTFLDDEGRFISEQAYKDWEKPPGTKQ